MPHLLLLRHGESTWNRDNLFTGWTDVDLTEAGRAQAWTAGEAIAESGHAPDVCFTSVLRRAIRTLWIALDACDRMWLPTTCDWRLNERHYGALQGLNKAEMADLVGTEQVHAWRRSWATRPPPLDTADPRWPGHDARYRDLKPAEVPTCESLADTVARLTPAWRDPLSKALKDGHTPLVAAHGNSLRALARILDDIPDDVIPQVEVPIGVVLVYDLDDRLKPLASRYVGAVPDDAELPAEVRDRLG